MANSVTLTNRALATIGTRSQISSLTDGSPEANYANILYTGLRDFLLREGDHDWSVREDSAVPIIPAPPHPWLFAYICPSDAIRIRQILNTSSDLLDPQPFEWNVIWRANAREILTKQEATGILLTFAPLEDIWDPIFTEAFVRLLASSLAFALENRIEASREKLSEALSFAGIANMRDS